MRGWIQGRRVSISSTGAILGAICGAEASKALIEGEGVERKGLWGGLCPPHPTRGVFVGVVSSPSVVRGIAPAASKFDA